MSLRTMYPPQKDSPSTFLLGDISTTDTLVTVANATIIVQQVPFPLTIGIDKTITETVMVTNINLASNQLTITRGDSPVAWQAGAKVARVLTAKDFKDLQDNVVDIDAELANIKDSVVNYGDDISELQTAVGDESSGLVKGLADEIVRAKAAENTEKTRAEAAETALSTSKVNRTELAQVITDWVYSSDGTKVLVTIARYNASNQQTSQYTRTLPVVSEEAMGVMTPEAYLEIASLRNDVNALQQLGGRFIGVSFTTKATLDSYVVPDTVKMGDFTYVLDDETQADATTRYVRGAGTWDFAFVVEYDPTGIADATTPGLVLSNTGSTEGRIFVETNGEMSVIGWSGLTGEVATKQNLITVSGLLKGNGSGAFSPAAKTDITALGIPEQDTVYEHPDNHQPTIILQDANNRFVTDAEKATWNDKLNKSGGTLTGAVVAGGAQALATAQVRNVTISTADPSGGSNGDLWFKYDEE